MQQRVSSATEHETISDDFDQGPSSKTGKLRILQFHLWPREEQLEAFLAWLPREIADIPGIGWTSEASAAP